MDDAERKHLGGEAIAPQDAVARQLEPTLPPVGIFEAHESAWKGQAARVPHRDEFVSARGEVDLDPLAFAVAQGEGRALRRVEPDSIAALPVQVRQIAG